MFCAAETGPDDPWLPVEDDILICMQNAASDPHFIHTMHWLNNAKGIGRTLPRTTQQAKARYAHLCAVGRKDQRLKDQNVIRTIAKLKKSMKQQQTRTTGPAPGATMGTGGPVQPGTPGSASSSTSLTSAPLDATAVASAASTTVAVATGEGIPQTFPSGSTSNSLPQPM